MSAAPVAENSGAEEVSGGAFGKKGIGWASFEWARNPYYNIVVIFIFTPYFANSVIQSGELGQTLVGVTIAIAGVIMAIVSPILGSIVDNAGAKKPFIFYTFGVLALCSILLGFVTPDLPGAIPIGMFLLIVGYCSYTVSELLHNAMLPGAGRSSALPLVSGLGLAMGNAAGMVLLIAIAVLSQNPPFGLAELDISRLTAPTIGFWLLVFMTIFFLLMPDVYKTGATWSQALKDFRNPANRVQPYAWVKSRFQQHPNVMRYLVGRMIYADGIAAMLTIGGVYVAGVLAWNGQQLAVYGIMASLFAVVGGFFGGVLDRLLGPKRALMFELSMAILIGIFQISITKDSLLFGLIPAGHTVWEGSVFSTLADLVYVLAVIPGTIFLVATISSSRYMLLHIAPPEKIGEFFGFYAMAGSVTVWLGPGSVALVTWLTNDQRAGFAPVVVLLMTGLAIIMTVKADKTPEHMKTKISA
ncbi:MAG: MFS transporter [Henriciella sp.]|nr:MFS transporter [Henriciella sp.]